MIATSKEIYNRYLEKEVDDDTVIKWSFYYVKRTVRDGGTVLFTEQETLKGDATPSQNSRYVQSLNMATLIKNARADEIHRGFSTTGMPTSSELASLLDKLENEDPTIRRNARDELAEIGANTDGGVIVIKDNDGEISAKFFKL